MDFKKVVALLDEEISAWGTDYEHLSKKGKEHVDARVDELKAAKEILQSVEFYGDVEKARYVLNNAVSADCGGCKGCGEIGPNMTCGSCGGSGILYISELK